MKKLNVKKLIRNLVKETIYSLMAVATVFGFFYLIGAIVTIAEIYFFAKMFLFIAGFIVIIKLVNESE